ncbi:MAG TPA: hypothetical protein VKC66_38070 [Xanthobacteraceae bacterium]|nr:hypothetical protein [Xanthobacteraceae bacterium]
MSDRFSTSMIPIAIAAAAVSTAVSVLATQTSAQTSFSNTALKTPWGEPDLQGIWTEEFDTPLQRPARFGNQEFFTDAQRRELDRLRAAHYGDDPRQERGSPVDVGGAYNTTFLTVKHVSARTSMIVDPPNGRLPPQTPQAQRAAAADREFFLALMQSTDACKNKEPVCAGGKYDPTISPRFAENPPRYHAVNNARLNRADGPEDDGLQDRCLRSGLPEFGSLFGGSFRRIVQTPGGISIFYDVNQGQGWQRNIVMNGSPHLPASIRQWFGDSRGHWEGDTLVVDVANFSPKTDVFGSRENLHLVERWTRTGPKSLAYEALIEDPTVWTRPWAIKQEFARQSDEKNRIYYEPRCIEGNFGLPGLLHGRRVEERTFADRRGPDPRTKDSVGGVQSVRDDPLQ